MYNTNNLKELKRRKDDHVNKITNNTDKVYVITYNYLKVCF